MPYYIRLLAEKDKNISVNEIEQFLKDSKIKCKLASDGDNDQDWEEISIFNKNNEEISILEKNKVEPDSLGQEEILEFIEEMDDYGPKSAADWLKNYLPKVTTIYAFQILNKIYNSNGWEIVNSIRDFLWDELDGIIQADNEGFSNTEGYHILWQFSDTAEGDWYMAIFENDSWTGFKMNLGNEDHKQAFIEGKVPKGVEIL